MNENDGIKAIIYLQSLVGITESEADAKVGWNNMSQNEQEHTIAVYKLFTATKTTEETNEVSP